MRNPIKVLAELVERKGNSREQGIVPKTQIQRFLPTSAVIVEAGAHVGKDTQELSALWPLGSVHAFEPVPHVFESLVNNTRLLKNVRAYPFALSDSCGTATMFVSDGRSNASSSLLPPKDHLADHPDVFFPGVVTVPTTTLDNWAVVNDISHVDFLWLDMQGFELAAMMAAPHILRTVTVFYTEVSLTETYAGVALYPEVRNWLEGQGFRVVREELPWADAGNVLFVRPNGDDIVYA